MIRSCAHLWPDVGTFEAKFGTKAAPDSCLAKRLARDGGERQRVHDPKRFVVSVHERPVVVLAERDQESSFGWRWYVDDAGSKDTFDRTSPSRLGDQQLWISTTASELDRILVVVRDS